MKPNTIPNLCPFCGSAGVVHAEKDDGDCWAVRCHCGLTGPTRLRRRQAIRAWNMLQHRWPTHRCKCGAEIDGADCVMHCGRQSPQYPVQK